MASTFGSKPDRSVIGASAGKFDWSSTAFTCGPAPMAKSISVAVGDSDTMAVGCASTVTAPLTAWMVTGNAASLEPAGAALAAVSAADDSVVVEESSPHEAATNASAASQRAGREC